MVSYFVSGRLKTWLANTLTCLHVGKASFQLGIWGSPFTIGDSQLPDEN
jgi:hypothetical protein